MALFDLKNADMYILDGTSGSAKVQTATPAAGDSSLSLSDVLVRTAAGTNLLQKGVRFKIGANAQIYAIQTVGAAVAGNVPVTFLPVIPAAQVPLSGDAVAFLPQQVELKLGEGNGSFEEKNNYEYRKNRGKLDYVKKGDEEPLQVDLDFDFEHATTGTDETISPRDALKQRGAASMWVTTSADLCEPYAVNVLIKHIPPCGTAEIDEILLENFRVESLKFDLKESKVTCSGKCNVTEPVYTRA